MLDSRGSMLDETSFFDRVCPSVFVLPDKAIGTEEGSRIEEGSTDNGRLGDFLTRIIIDLPRPSGYIEKVYSR